MTTRRRRLLAVLLVPLIAACGPDPAPIANDTPLTPSAVSTQGAARGALDAGQTVTVELAGRPFQLHVPRSYTPSQPVPLIVLLHGYRASASIQESYFKLTAESERRGFLYALPDGSKEKGGNRFWNATDACCNFFESTVDDSGYLSDMIREIKALYAVDAQRVFVVGHSNGGFMSYRMACDHADEITAIVSLAGAMWQDASRCTPARPVSVLEIHGTADKTIKSDGGTNVGHSYPSVASTLAAWRRLNGCADTASAAAPHRDLVRDLAGAETTVTSYTTNCRAGSRVELWTINNGSHVPAFNASFAAAVIDFLYAQ